MAKEAINKPDSFEKGAGDTPVIDLESREVKNVDKDRDGSQQKQKTSTATLGPNPAAATIDVSITEPVRSGAGPSAVAGTEGEEAKSAADASGDAESGSTEEAAGGLAGEPAAAPNDSPEELLGKLISALQDMREGRDAISMRRDLVSLHDKLMPEIQASRDAAREAEAANQSNAEAIGDLRTLLTKVDGSISGLEGYLLVNLEERLQGLGQSLQGRDRSGRIPRWLKLAVAGNLILTACILAGLLWPQQTQGLLEAVSSFSIDAWIASMEPRP